VDAVITVVADQIFFLRIKKLHRHYFLNILVKFYGIQALRKG